MLCSGAAWRDLPERFGPRQTVRYHRVFTSYALILSSAVISVRFPCSAWAMRSRSKGSLWWRGRRSSV
ncbi:hypothetical protein AWN76_006705 [Rhodothermaceae bacterium RA]|nr:hypothetical protein AWN76_006705 [Rhodothermaceae bacterium RA]